MSTRYSVSFNDGLGLSLLVREQDSDVKITLEHGDGDPTLASVTYTLWDASGTKIVDAAGATENGNSATYTVPVATLVDTLSFGDGWREEWSVSDGTDTFTFRNTAALAKYAYHPGVGQGALEKRWHDYKDDDLYPDGYASRNAYYQDKIDEATIEMEQELRKQGRRPWLIVDAGMLRTAFLYLVDAVVNEDRTSFLSGNANKWSDRAKASREAFRAHFDSLVFAYDADEDGVADETTTAHAPLILSSTSPRQWWLS